MGLTVLQALQYPVVNAFRHFYIRRRLDDSSGNYETSWFDISDEVKSWGNISWELDEKQYAHFQQSNVSIVCQNHNGQFNSEDNAGSYWSGYLTRYKTLVKIQVGFLDTAGSEVPPTSTSEASTPSQFVGVITEPIELTGNNEAVINIKALTSVLEDVPANLLVVASAGAAGNGQMSPYTLMVRMRDVTDGSSNLILQRFISSGAWDLESGTQTMTALDTLTSLDGYNCWTLAKKLAETANKSVWIDKLGGLHFKAQTPTSAVQFIFSGNPYNNTTYGHTIKDVESMIEDYDYLYNRVRVKFGTTDTSTSWKKKQETWVVGDSTTSWKYGVKTLEIDNTWLSSTTADNIASTLYASLNQITEKVELKCKFIPTLALLNRTSVEYDVVRADATRWDFFNWDNANWDTSVSPVYDFVAKEYKIIGLEHDIDNMETNVTLRSI